MIDDSPHHLTDDLAKSPPVDIGALAGELRPAIGSAPVVLWWSILIVLIVACVYPHPATVAAVWVYVIVLVWKRRARRIVFHRNLKGLPCLSSGTVVDSRPEWPKVTALIPARDEEENIEEAARSLTRLSYPNLDIWFINDHSSDRTPHILDKIRREFPRVHVLHDPPTTEGWFGKSNALWQAFLQIDHRASPRNENPEWLLFADADVVFQSDILHQAVTVAERDSLDFLTCMPRLIAKTLAEQFLLPTGWRGILEGTPFDRLNDPNAFPIGVGAFMLIRYSTYRAFGGHKALGQWHPEDTLMAAAVKKIGDRVGLAWTRDLMRVRFYRGYRQVKTNTLRKTRIFFGDQIQLPLSMMGMRLSTTLMALPMIASGIVPQIVAGRFDLLLTLIAAAGIVLYIDEANEYKGVEQIAEFHPLVPWLHPVSGALRVWFALSLAGQILLRKPMQWRGRREFGMAKNSTR